MIFTYTLTSDDLFGYPRYCRTDEDRRQYDEAMNATVAEITALEDALVLEQLLRDIPVWRKANLKKDARAKKQRRARCGRR